MNLNYRERMLVWAAFCKGAAGYPYADYQRAVEMESAAAAIRTPADALRFYVRFVVWKNNPDATPRQKWRRIYRRARYCRRDEAARDDAYYLWQDYLRFDSTQQEACPIRLTRQRLPLP